MTDDMRAKMMQKLSTSPASQLEQRQLAGVSGAGTSTEATPSGVQPVDWRAKHIEEAYTYRRGATGHGTVSQAAFVPRFADSLAEPRVLAVARAVLDQHIRVAQVEALGKSVQPAVRTNGSHRGWQCVSGPQSFCLTTKRGIAPCTASVGCQFMLTADSHSGAVAHFAALIGRMILKPLDTKVWLPRRSPT